MKLLTAEQVRAALEVANPGFRPFVAVCVFAGLRLGEAAGLQLGDVDVARRTLAVARQVQGQTIETTRVEAPKYGSERTVYLPDALVEILRDHETLLGGQRGGHAPARPGPGADVTHQAHLAVLDRPGHKADTWILDAGNSSEEVTTPVMAGCYRL